MIAMIGDKKSGLLFKAFGIAAFEANNPSEAQKILDSITQYNVVFVTEGLIETEIPPNVTVIPGIKGSIGYGESFLRNLIKKATGTEPT